MDGLNLENQLDEKTKEVILKMESEIELKNKELISKDKEIDVLKNELAYLKGQILTKNRKIFGKSSEQLDTNQISLFDEAEKFSDLKAAEPTIEEITYKRTKSSKNRGKKDNLANLEKKVIEHKLEGNKAICDKCNNSLTAIGIKTKEVLKYIPAKLYIEEHVSYSYACKPCEKLEAKANIISAPAPKTLLHKSMASNELLAHVINLKYQHAMPLNRQESYFKMLGANLSRQTMANWIIKASDELKIIYDLMKKELLKSNYVQADETTVQVIENDGKDSKSKKYMWLYKTGASKDPIILYDYQKTRSSSCPRDFLKGFSGYLQTDGYNGYNKVENIKRLYCLAHIRRKYHDIIVNLDKEALKKSKAITGFNFCEKLYEIEKDLREKYSEDEDYYEKRYKVRLKKSAPIIDDFIEYVDKEILNAVPRSPLGQALEYSKKLLPNFKTFLEDGVLEIDNNASERSIKPFVVGRKNWLFSTSAKGASASALMYSLIQTAKANNLIVEKYLMYLMDVLAATEDKNSEDLKDLLAWSKKLPQELRIATRS